MFEPGPLLGGDPEFPKFPNPDPELPFDPELPKPVPDPELPKPVPDPVPVPAGFPFVSAPFTFPPFAIPPAFISRSDCGS